jgi:hypothetical protein
MKQSGYWKLLIAGIGVRNLDANYKENTLMQNKWAVVLIGKLRNSSTIV